MSDDTVSVHSTESIHSSHSKDGNADNYKLFKDDMIRFLKCKEGLYQCNRLIAKEAWIHHYGVKYSPFETYGLKLQQLVEKYSDDFYFEGKGHNKWICLAVFKDAVRPSLSKDNNTHLVTASRPAPRPAPREPTISVDDVAYIISSLENLSMAEFMNLVSECKEKGLDPNSLNLLAQSVVN